MTWYPFEAGTTIGECGSENGVILQDEQHEEGSRITLERGGYTAPFAITCGIYGWMVHTRFFNTEAEAAAEYVRMQVGLVEILKVIPYDEDPEKEAKMKKVVELLQNFVRRFP